MELCRFKRKWPGFKPGHRTSCIRGLAEDALEEAKKEEKGKKKVRGGKPVSKMGKGGKFGKKR